MKRASLLVFVVLSGLGSVSCVMETGSCGDECTETADVSSERHESYDSNVDSLAGDPIDSDGDGTPDYASP